MEQFIIIFGAKYLILLPILMSVTYFFFQSWRTKKDILIFGISTIIVIGTLALVAGHFYNNPRPFVVENFTPLIPHASDNGFPSDHVLLASAIAIVVSFYNRKLAIILWIITIIIAFCRVAVGVHHPVDVIASIVISILSGVITYLIIKNVNLHIGNKIKPK